MHLLFLQSSNQKRNMVFFLLLPDELHSTRSLSASLRRLGVQTETDISHRTRQNDHPCTHSSSSASFWKVAPPSCASPPSGNLKVFPKLRDCCSVVLNISYRRISASDTDRRANRIASSKWSLIGCQY